MPSSSEVSAARSQLREIVAREFPGARTRFLVIGPSGRHLVARTSTTRDSYFVKMSLVAGTASPDAGFGARTTGASAARGSVSPRTEQRADSSALPKTSLEHEVLAWRAAAKAAVAPEIISASSQYFISAAASGKSLLRLDSAALKALARTLVLLHRARVPKKLRPLPGGANILAALSEGERVLSYLRAKKIVSAPHSKLIAKKLAALSARPRELASYSAGEEKQAICHGDVRAPNIFFDEDRAWLIDFETAGRGDPAIELARTAAYERLSRHQFFVFCDAYAEAAKDDAVIDRAIALAPAIALILVLQAARFVHVQADLSRHETLQQRISDLVERPVRLELR